MLFEETGLRITLCAFLTVAAAMAAVPVVTDPAAGPRELYGAERLRAALAAVADQAPAGAKVVVARRAAAASESFRLERQGNDWIVAGADPSGVLYGCLELARRIKDRAACPRTERVGRPGLQDTRHESVLDEMGREGLRLAGVRARTSPGSSTAP